MNEQLTNWIWNYSKVTRSQEILVLLALAQHCRGCEATVKLAELVRLTRLSKDDIRIAIRRAVRINELAIIQNVDDAGSRLTNTYRFLAFYRPATKEENGADNIEFNEPATLPGITVPKVQDLPRPAQPKIMMDALQLDMLALDPVYKGLDVRGQAWKFKRWCRAQVPPAQETVRRFKMWLSKV
jgi:hypothetical protein